MQERLQKIIARAGIASRRHAEQLILSGQVRVNGRVVTELGTKADAATDRIEAAGRVVKGAERRVKMKRVGLGPLTVEGVQEGRYEMLRESEVEKLQKALRGGKGS